MNNIKTNNNSITNKYHRIERWYNQAYSILLEPIINKIVKIVKDIFKYLHSLCYSVTEPSNIEKKTNRYLFKTIKNEKELISTKHCANRALPTTTVTSSSNQRVEGVNSDKSLSITKLQSSIQENSTSEINTNKLDNLKNAEVTNTKQPLSLLEGTNIPTGEIYPDEMVLSDKYSSSEAIKLNDKPDTQSHDSTKSSSTKTTKKSSESFSHVSQYNESSVKEPQDVIVEDEIKIFCKNIFNPENRDFRNLIIMLVNNQYNDLPKIATLILDQYIERFNQKTINKQTKQFLQKFILENISLSFHHPNKESRIFQGKELQIYNTKGDGSCGFHALLGRENKNKKYECNAKEKRKELCNWIKDNFSCKDNELQMPSYIVKNILKDHFLNFKHAPNDFKNKYVIDKFNQLNYEKIQLSKEQQDQRTDAFINDPKVLDSYLQHLANVENWILQDELILAAHYFNMKINLYQPGWGNNPQIIGHSILNENGKNEVSIWYNGFNHYEKAFLVED